MLSGKLQGTQLVLAEQGSIEFVVSNSDRLPDMLGTLPVVPIRILEGETLKGETMLN